MKFDGAFWGYVLVGVISIGSLGCLGFAAVHSRSPQTAEIVSTDNCPPPADLL